MAERPWLVEQFERAKEDVRQWPRWMRQVAGLEERGEPLSDEQAEGATDQVKSRVPGDKPGNSDVDRR
jgi:hypothetical protein